MSHSCSPDQQSTLYSFYRRRSFSILWHSRRKIPTQLLPDGVKSCQKKSSKLPPGFPWLVTLGNIFIFSRICNPLNCAQHPAQLSVVIIILKDFSSELLFCIPLFFSLLKYMSDISMLQALYYFTNLPLFVSPNPTFLLLHVLILFCFRFVEIRNYKIDLVSLLSVDLITGSTVIPVIPHRQGRDSPASPFISSPDKSLALSKARISLL